jgi:glucose-1-phosphate cytidylyltransferase
MKAVILAGGYGTRISEETGIRPKPMVEIGNWPILWHILKYYSSYEVNDFIICLGYKGHMIKEFFANYYLYKSDMTFDMESNAMNVLKNGAEPWKVTLVDTGENTMTGGRLKLVRQYVGDETFCFTYGDGLSDINLHDLIQFHRDQNVLATLSAVQQPGRFGAFPLGEGQTKVTRFREKPKEEGAWINGGFFILEPQVFEYIADASTVWEREPLEMLARQGQLGAYRHHGFWHPMDTLRDKMILENYWSREQAPWKVWEEEPIMMEGVR